MKHNYPKNRARRTASLTVSCTNCGATFTRRPNYKTRLCPECDRAHKRDLNKKYFSDRLRMPSLSSMSPVRRRIEQRRLANAKYYAMCGEVVA